MGKFKASANTAYTELIGNDAPTHPNQAHREPGQTWPLLILYYFHARPLGRDQEAGKGVSVVFVRCLHKDAMVVRDRSVTNVTLFSINYPPALPSPLWSESLGYEILTSFPLCISWQFCSYRRGIQGPLRRTLRDGLHKQDQHPKKPQRRMLLRSCFLVRVPELPTSALRMNPPPRGACRRNTLSESSRLEGRIRFALLFPEYISSDSMGPQPTTSVCDVHHFV